MYFLILLFLVFITTIGLFILILDFDQFFPNSRGRLSRFIQTSEAISIILFVIIVLALLSFIIGIVRIPVTRLQTGSMIHQHKIIQTTVDTMRENHIITDFERIKMSEDIIDANKKLAHLQFYAAHPWFSIYHPSEILELEPIK